MIEHPLAQFDEGVLKRMGLTASAASKYSVTTPKALEVRDSAIYVDGIITDSEWGKFIESIYGDLNLVYPEAFREALAQVEGDVDLYVNSPGGSVFDASTMLTDLEERAGSHNVNVIVNGLCASAATYFLVGGSSRKIGKMGMVMVHQAWSIAIGNSTDFEKMVNLLQKMDQAYIDMIAEFSGMDRSKVESAVMAETWFTAEEAIEADLVDGAYDPKNKGGDGEGGEGEGQEMSARKRFGALAQQMRF